MNISNSTASLASQASSSHSRPQGPPPGGKEQLSSALQSIGVDDSTAARVLEQIDVAISALNSESSSGSSSRAAVRSVVDDVLEANGIDSAEVGEAIQAAGVSGAGRPSGSGGPSGAGRPHGPPPPRKDDESETSEVESGLLSAGVEATSTDELISQIIETIQELTTDAASSVSQDDFRSALTSLFEENGADFEAFEKAFSTEFGSAGSFLELLV